ncbi:hypothetical protein M2273_000080 [Mucilaginibacter lappiensis]
MLFCELSSLLNCTILKQVRCGPETMINNSKKRYLEAAIEYEGNNRFNNHGKAIPIPG